MKNIILSFLLLGICYTLSSQTNYYMEYTGSGSASNIVGNEVFTYTATGGSLTKCTVTRFPIAQTESILTNSQTISNHQVLSNPTSTNYQAQTDAYGNQYATFEINGPLTTLSVTRKYNATTNVDFTAQCLEDSYPLSSVPSTVQVYTNPSTNIQSNNSSIKAEAQSIVQNSMYVKTAVEEIAKWIRGNIEYHTASGFAQDAASVYSTRTVTKNGVTKTGRFGNCEGFTNLTIAMLRSLGIPARYVGGYVLPKSYTLNYTGGSITLGGSGPGAHAVHEIYYPSIGEWVRGDGQSSVHFGSTNFIKTDHGPDSDVTGESFSFSYSSSAPAPTISQNRTINTTIGSVSPNYTYLDMSTFGGTNNGKLILGGVILTEQKSTSSECRDFVVGIYDKVKIKDATESFSPGQNVSYSADFTSGWGDTWPVEWNWYMRLYHKDGIYELAKEEGGSSYWSFTTNSSLPDYQWERDPSGNIYGEVNVVVEINDGDWKSDNIPIFVQYKPNQPIVNIASYINESDPLNNSFTFSIDSKGADSYKVYYSSSNTAHQGNSPISIINGDVVTLSNLNYSDKFWVTGLNGKGESSTSNKISVAKYFSLPYTFTGIGDQNLCVTKYESDHLARVNVASGGVVLFDANQYFQGLSKACADFHLNLFNEKDVIIEFEMKNFHPHNYDDDGIYLSTNGGSTFNKLFKIIPSGSDYNHYLLNISDLAENAGLAFTKNTVIRIQQIVYAPFPYAGNIYKNIKFYSSFTPASPIRNMTLGAEKDALLILNTNPNYTYQANSNYGSYSMIKTDEWTHSGYRTNTKSLVDFDLSRFPENTVIKSAKLSLYANNPQPNDGYKQMTNYSTNNSGFKSNASWLYRVTENWDENSVTYNACPEVTDLNGEYFPVSETYTQNYVNIDVTNVVQDMIQNPDYSYGFMLSLDNEKKYTRMAFASSDHSNSALHPKLTIEHYQNQQVYTAPFTVIGSTSSESNNWDVQGGDGRDKEYLVYITNTSYLDISTCKTSTEGVTNYDTKLEVFKADKSTTGYYNDDDPQHCGYNYYSSAINGAEFTPGYYYFVVDGYNGATGNFQLSVTTASTLKSATINEKELVIENKEISEPMDVLIYPNPVCDELNAILPEEKTKIRIVDMHGRILKTLNSIHSEISINCSDLPQGVYVIQVQTSKSVEVRIFEKQ